MKITRKHKAFIVTVLLLVCVNLFCHTKVWVTEIRWITVLGYTLILTIPYYFLFFYKILKESPKDQERIREQLQYVKSTSMMSKRTKLITSFFLGYLLCFLTISCVPIAVNYYFSSQEKEYFTTSQFTIAEEDAHSSDDVAYKGVDQHTYSVIRFFHNDVYISYRVEQQKGAKNLYYIVQKGLLGFPIITKCSFTEQKESYN